MVRVSVREKGEALAEVACAAGAADAVYVVFDGGREVVVDHGFDVLDVQAPRGDVGGHEHVDVRLEVAEDLVSLLRQSAVPAGSCRHEWRAQGTPRSLASWQARRTCASWM